MLRAAYGQHTIFLTVAANAVNLNLFALAGSPTSPVSVRVAINAGVVIGSSNTSLAALDVGQFPAGSRIQIVNAGSIQGAGGAGGSYYSTGAPGGDAIRANYPNQTVEIINSGQVLGGGGGGGSGGLGGAGGTGGQGYYQALDGYYYNGSTYYWYYSEGSLSVVWGGSIVYSGYPGDVAAVGDYRRGSLMDSGSIGGGKSGPPISYASYQVGRVYNIYTSGGGGGGGGTGGAGGRGTGYGQSNLSGSGGNAGSNGSAGGTNAGRGGSGGTGGTGGAGGGWGTAGATGNNGATGNTGASGNYSGGLGGAAGGVGAAGGAAGRYLLKGSAAVSFINNGTIAGGLA